MFLRLWVFGTYSKSWRGYQYVYPGKLHVYSDKLIGLVTLWLASSFGRVPTWLAE